MSAKIYRFPTQPQRDPVRARVKRPFLRLGLDRYWLEDRARFGICLIAVVLMAAALNVGVSAFIAYALGAGDLVCLGLLTAGVVLAAWAVLLLIECPARKADDRPSGYEVAS